MKNLLNKNLSELKQFNKQRKLWLLLSLFVMTSISFIIFDWNHIQQYKLEWTMGSIGVVISAVWWYWTMRLIRHLIQHKTDEYQILSELITEIKDIKAHVREVLPNKVDKDN